MKTYTGHDLRRIRHQLGWSIYEMAKALRLSGDDRKGGQRVHHMEEDHRALGGPTQTVLEALESGWRPAHMGDAAE